MRGSKASRPKVMERLGLGPDICLALRSPQCVRARHRLGSGRTSGARHSGHDLNYIALTGALHAISRASGPPTPPLNLVGDFGGGALYLVVGVLAAIIEARRSGRGRVVDAAMVPVAIVAVTSLHGAAGGGPHGWRSRRQRHRFRRVLLQGLQRQVCQSPPFRWRRSRSGGFHAELLRLLEIDAATMPPQMDRSPSFPKVKQRLAERFRTRTRDEWCALLEGGDACFAQCCIDGGGARPSAQPCAQGLRRGRWCSAACAGAALRSLRRSIGRRRRNRPVRPTCELCCQTGGSVTPTWILPRQPASWHDKSSILPRSDQPTIIPESVACDSQQGGPSVDG